MNLKMIALASACVFASSMSFAQTATPADKPAVATPDTTNLTAPVKGENSFTEAQAKERIEKDGYSDVMGLKLDDNGIWQAAAKKAGADVTVKMDYQGNITSN